MDKLLIALFALVGIIVLAAVIGLAMAFPIMWCWNYAIVSIFGLPAITWGKAWCLSFLANCLIKSTLTTNNS
jgi:hypothetical protein